MQKTGSLTVLVGLGLIASMHACSSTSSSPNGPSALDASTNPPQGNGANPPQGDAAGLSPSADTGEPLGDAARSAPMDAEVQNDSQGQDNGGKRDASVPLPDAADAALISRA